MNLKHARATLPRIVSAPATALLAIALLLAGCAELRTSLAEDSPRYDVPQSQSLLTYAASLRGSTGSELAAELESLNRGYAQHRTEDNRIRLAIFHAITPAGDRARALSLLDLPPGENAGRGRNHPIAVLLIPLLQENRRSDENLVASSQRLRDEQKRSEALQQKLDAIRDIEKKMIERPTGPAQGKTP